MNSDEKYIKYGKTLSGLIHNLNTPLMGMSGRIELMQMKFGDDKNIIQVSTQLDRINNILTSIAFLLDKEMSNKDSGFDLKTLLDNYFSYLTTDMKFKHKLEKEINITPHSINTNGCDVLNFVHAVMSQLLNYVENEAALSITNSIEGNNAIIDIILTFEDEITQNQNITDLINKRLHDEIKQKYTFTADITGNKITVKIIIKSNE